MLTENEARTKWCPFIHARITIVLPAGDKQVEQRADNLLRADRCIASTCMVWRARDNIEWVGISQFLGGAELTSDSVKIAIKKAQEEGFDLFHPNADQFLGVSIVVGRRLGAVGYCGLASNPEAVS